MQTGWLTRMQVITLYIISQLVIPVLAAIFFLILSIYILNILFIQPDKMVYFDEIYLYAFISFFLFIFCFYITLLIIVLNLLKFGKSKLAGILVNTPYLISPETRLYYFYVTGQKTKALELSKKLKNLEKRTLAKLLCADVLMLNNRLREAEKLFFMDKNDREIDIVKAKEALLYLKKKPDSGKAEQLIQEALDLNRNAVVRNSDPKYLEISLINAEIYISANKEDKALDILNYWHDTATRHIFYFKARYSALLLSQYYLLYGLCQLKVYRDYEKAEYYLNNAIKTFKGSIYAASARKILENI
jgi:tetratricopeptide (TPR) repeat protein